MNCPAAPLRIGDVVLASPVILAPMAGVTDRPFRRLVRQFGVGLVVSEMIASQAMIRENRATLRLAEVRDDETPMAVQLVGGEAEVMAEAARLNEDRGAVAIDINFGCPVRKIVGTDAGSALMRDLPRAQRIMAMVVASVRLPVTVKMRLGWDAAHRNAVALARIAENCGIAMITVHGRTRDQFYAGRADWDAVGLVKQAVRIPVVVNGDIASPDDAALARARSGADGVMIGRGALGRPWLPQQVARRLAGEPVEGPPSIDARRDILLRHFDAMLDHYGSEPGVKVARKHIGWSVSGLPGSAAFREDVNRLSDPDAVRRHIVSYFAPLVERMAA